MASDGKPQEDNLVSKLIPDPAQGPPDAIALSGYLGRSPQAAEKGKPTVWRLYRTHSLDTYVEIPEDEILHTQKLPDEQGSVVWVPKSLPLNYVQVNSGQVQAELLGSGQIAQAGAVAAQGTSTPTPVASAATVCSRLAVCPSVRCLSVIPCPSTTIVCPTHESVCLSSAPSHCTICPTPSATPSHCTICPTPSATPSHCTLCPPSALPSHCTICATPTATPSDFVPCATPTAPVRVEEIVAPSVITHLCPPKLPSLMASACESIRPALCRSFFAHACPPPISVIECPIDPNKV